MTNPSHQTPYATPTNSQDIKAVAIYEIIKGMAAIGAVFALWQWHDPLTRWLQNPHNLPFFESQRQNLNQIAQNANQNWQWFVVGILAYASLRFLEAYGLWQDKRWAYWFSVIGYGLFLPLELYALIKTFDWIHLLLFLINLAIVLIVYHKMKQKGLI